MPYNRCLAAWASVCVSMNVATLALVVGAASTGHRSQDGPKMLLPTRLSLCRVRPPGCAGPHRTRLPGCAETHRIKTCPFPESHHAWAGEGKSQHGTPSRMLTHTPARANRQAGPGDHMQAKVNSLRPTRVTGKCALRPTTKQTSHSCGLTLQ